MPGRISYKAAVAKDLRKLQRQAAVRIVEKVEESLRAGSMGQPLSGEFAGLYRLRVGDHGVVYSRTDGAYLVLRIGARRDVCRKSTR